VAECVFAPYFSTDQGAARFAAIHKVFGASNAAKLLAHLPAADRCEAVVTITYEAQSRLRDPVYGCVAQIFALQQQVTSSLLLHSPPIDRSAGHFRGSAMDALLTCLSQVAILQAQLMQAKAQLACGVQSTTSPVGHHQQWPDSSSIAAMLRQQDANSSGFAGGAAHLPELMGGDVSMSMMQQHCGIKADGAGAGELQYLAQAMMQSSNYSL
jgi:hypothetical protein